MWRGALLLSLLLLMAQAPAEPQAGGTDRLFAALKAAPDEQTAAILEAHIRSAWTRKVPPSAVLLLNRAARELQGNGQAEAMEDFSAAIDLDPGNAELWSRRAEARLQVGDAAGAVRDTEEVLKREPRHFPALQALSHGAETRGDWRGALAAWQKVLEIDPKTPGGQARLKDLRRRALGEEM